jgi:ferredoxin
MKDDDSPNKSFREILQSPVKNAKRSILLDLLNGFTSTGKVEISIKESPLLEFNVSPDCTGCNTCATLCPTGAIVYEAVENKYQLKFRPHLCVNCRTCVNTCLYKAIQPKETALLNNLLEKPEWVVFKGEKRSCPICQIDFIGSNAEICPFCLNTRRKKNELISSLLENTEGRNKHVW